jgi:hypothetical protein
MIHKPQNLKPGDRLRYGSDEYEFIRVDETDLPPVMSAVPELDQYWCKLLPDGPDRPLTLSDIENATLIP